MTAALVIIACQAAVIVALLVFVRTFGRYSDTLMQVHRSNTLLYQQSIKILDHAMAIMDPNREKPAA